MMRAGTFRLYGGLAIAAISGAILLLGAITEPAPPDEAAELAAHPFGHCGGMRVTTVTGEILETELAMTTRARAEGLMGRRSLDPDSGMLFIFDAPRTVDFWMRDVLIGLDLIFIGHGGMVAGIHRGAVPGSEDLIASPGPVVAVLETVENRLSDADLAGRLGFDCLEAPA